MHWLDFEAPAPESIRLAERLRGGLAARRRPLIAAAVAAPLAILIYFMLAPLQYRATAQIAVAAAGETHGEAQNGPTADQREMWLIASRELGRRAIRALWIDRRAEFDPPPGGALAPALVFLGLAADPTRVSPEQRLLDAYEERLSLRAAGPGRVDIGFRASDPAFAAAAANRIASLYLDMRGDAGSIVGDTVATLAAPAVKPVRPLLPRARLLAFVAAGASLLAALAAAIFWRAPRRRLAAEAPVEPPRAIGDAPVFVRLKAAPRIAHGGQTPAARRIAEGDAAALDALAARIGAGRRGGGALCIVGGGFGAGGAADLMLALARRLGGEGRSILIFLDDSDRGAAALAPPDGPGFADLLAGSASFAEAIRRDPRSRLHVIGAGGAIAAEALESLGDVLDALAGAYDFIWLLTPPVDGGDTARIVAAAADIFVLTAPAEPASGAVAQAEASLRAAGAGTVLVIGAAPPQRRYGQDAA